MKSKLLRNFVLFVLLTYVIAPTTLLAEDGYRLWLRYETVKNSMLAQDYKQIVKQVEISKSLDNYDVIKNEISSALTGMLSGQFSLSDTITTKGTLLIGTFDCSKYISQSIDPDIIAECGSEGYLILSTGKSDSKQIIIAANTSRGLLYGTFHFLRLMQTGQSLENLSILQNPRLQKRLLNHWDNLNGSVERGYAGKSIWKWDNLPQNIDPRIKDYARANASIGINGVVLNNVNSQAEILRQDYLAKAVVIADILRPYGIQIYFSVKFTSPKQIGGLDTADPLDPQVIQWWQDKAAEIYKIIPDFGGFLVKAYSEGQPGPQQYGRSHADGANMLAQALAPYNGIVMWRSFVYDLSIDSDRTKCAYLEFVPLDGKFDSNVLIQTKNGPIDFQPREPFSPLFGSMPKTPLMMELQITQEYSGQAQHLVYLAPQWKEVLDSDTYANGPGTKVSSIIDGSAESHSISGIAGVSGIGSDRNWCGHHFSQANWYAFGRLTWAPDLKSDDIAREWIKMTWSDDPKVVDTLSEIMACSWPACIDYMTPLGLHHLMHEGHHYGPQPDYVHPVRHDWSSTYYHKAGKDGIGFNRSSTGTNAVNQYHPPLNTIWDSPEACPNEYLLWFHHLPWSYRMKSGDTLWHQLQTRYNSGVDEVRDMQKMWLSLSGKIDHERFEHVKKRLQLQLENAEIWRDTCLKYFGQFADKSVTN